MANQKFKISPNSDSYKEATQKYNGVEHRVEVFLDNSGTPELRNRFPINPSAIVRLEIEDSLTNWVTKGTMTFLYMLEENIDDPEKLTGQKIATAVFGAIENGRALKSFSFRGDGFDLLRIGIMPESRNKNDEGLPVDTNDSRWIMSYIFSITDVEDIDNVPNLGGQSGAKMRCLKIYFEDFRQTIMRNTNLEYSTALSPDATDRKVPTGNALMEVFNKALTDPDLGGHRDLIIEPKKGEWDKGGESIFYTSPAEYSAKEDIEYILANHVSDTTLETGANDMSVLHTKRASEFNSIEPICLEPLTSIFSKALKGDQPGELQYEHFYVTAATEANSSGNLNCAPSTTNPFSKNDLKTGKFGQITNYSFVDMSPKTNAGAFRTTPVYSVDIGKRAFVTEFKNNTIKEVRNTIADSYISKMFTAESRKKEDLFTGCLHKSKKKGNVFPTFTLNGESEILRQRNGLHNLLYTGLFHNCCISFSTLGLTLRSAGVFIAIDRTQGVFDCEYNNKVYGQWLVVKVEHIFEAGAYYNRIYAVKPYRFLSKQKFGETI